MEQLKRVKQEYWNLIFIAAIAVLLFWNFTLNDKVDYLERGFREANRDRAQITDIIKSIEKQGLQSLCHEHLGVTGHIDSYGAPIVPSGTHNHSYITVCP